MASGWFFGLNATDDQLVWRTMLGPHPNAVITVSATVHRGGLLVGVSSTENQFGPVTENQFGPARRLRRSTPGRAAWRRRPT